MATSNTSFIYGYNAVEEALKTRPDVVRTLFLEPGKHQELKALSDTPIQALSTKRLPGGLNKTAVHQGVVAEIDTKALVIPYKEFIADLTLTPKTALVVLGELQDPHNVGAVIRSAAAFGLSGVLIPPHRQSSVTGTVMKVSAGMAFTLPLVEISNVNTTLRDLKERGFWVYGLDGEGDVQLGEEVFDRPSVFVVGNEGDGLRPKTAEACDATISIPMHPRCESLNVSNAAAVTFYEWQRQISNR